MLQPITQAVTNGAPGAHADAGNAGDPLKAQLEHARLMARLHEERLQLLLQTSGDGLWDWNLRTDELYLSERWFNITSLVNNNGGNGTVSALWLSLIHPDDIERVMSAVYGHLRNEIPRFEAEYRVICPDGETRWIHSRGVANRDERGQPHRMVGSHRDVGERKRAEDRIRESQEIIRRNEERFRALIENGSDMISMVDTRGVVTYQSPSIVRTLGYVSEEIIGTNAIELIHPDDREAVLKALKNGLPLAHGPLTAQVRVRHHDGSYRWLEVIVSSPPNQSGERRLILNSRDITERVEATAVLEREVARRTRELQTLLTINRTVSSTLDLSSLLETILDTAGSVVEANVVNLFELDERAQTLKLLKYRGEQSADELAALSNWALTRFDNEVIDNRRPLIIRDMADAGDAVAAAVASAHRQRFGSAPRFAARMCLPLIARDRVLGVMTFDSSKAGYYSESIANLAVAFASQAAAAIENARLYAAEQMRLKIAEGMREQVRMLNSNISRDEIFSRVLQQVTGAMMANAAVVFELDKDSKMLESRHSHGLPAGFNANLSVPLGVSLIGRAVQERRVTTQDIDSLIQTLRAEEPAGERLAYVESLRERVNCRWLMAIPLISDREVYGGIVLFFSAPRNSGGEDLALAATIGYQSALGIENSRLREEAAKSAIAQERYRIARDLHDSVSQALYGISLGARTAKQIVAVESPRATDAVEYVLSLAEGGLAEMRAIILELSPESLTSEGLVIVLQKQMGILAMRHKLKLDLKLGEEPYIPVQHKEALYRISMEAMQNVIKHAQATMVEVSMCTNTGANGRPQVCITLRDDGKGFDLNRTFPGHMGLSNMRERAEVAGGQCDISSRPGKGTTIRVTMPLAEDASAES